MDKWTICQRNDTQALSPGLQIPQDFLGNLPWDHGITPLYTQNPTELSGLEGASEVHLVQHPQAFLIFLMILQGLPVMGNVQTHTSENRILMNIPQMPHRHGPEWHQHSRCDIGRAVSLLHFHKVHPCD